MVLAKTRFPSAVTLTGAGTRTQRSAFWEDTMQPLRGPFKQRVTNASVPGSQTQQQVGSVWITSLWLEQNGPGREWKGRRQGQVPWDPVCLWQHLWVLSEWIEDRRGEFEGRKEKSDLSVKTIALVALVKTDCQRELIP